jgi:hypothetical protein
LFQRGGSGRAGFARADAGPIHLSDEVQPLTILLGQQFRNRLRKQKRFGGRLGEFGIAGRFAVEIFGSAGTEFFEFADPLRIDVTSQSATGIVALFLGGGNLAIEPAKEVDEPGIVVEVSFRVVALGEFLEQDLGKPSGGGLETDFGQFRGVAAAEEIEEMILLDTVLKGLFLGQGPFEVAAGGPIGNVALGDAVDRASSGPSAS